MSGIGALGKIIAKGGGDAIRKILPKTSRDYYDQFDPQTYYHATMEDIDIFDPNRGFMDDGTSRGATYFSSSPEYVNEYLDEFFDLTYPNQYETGARIYPVKIKTKNLFDYENKDHINKLESKIKDEFEIGSSEYEEIDDVLQYIPNGSWGDFENSTIQKSLKDLGFSGYKTSEPGTVGLFNSDKGDVRSVFAKFDPKQEKSGEILATVTPYASVSTLGALAGLEEST